MPAVYHEIKLASNNTLFVVLHQVKKLAVVKLLDMRVFQAVAIILWIVCHGFYLRGFGILVSDCSILSNTA